jgi:hypothetical protein
MTPKSVTSLLFAFAFGIGVAPSHAATLTLTGAELFAFPTASFPTVGATVSGSSLIFDPTTANHQKMFVLPISPGANYSISMNLTRLPAQPGAYPGDYDPHLVIGNGTSMVGVGAYDPTPGGGRGVTYDDGGSVGLNRQVEILFSGYAQPYPSNGNNFTINADFSLRGFGTQVALSVLGSSATFDTSEKLLPPISLYLALVGDNDVGEHYQLNWLSVTSPSLRLVQNPLPGALPLFATGLGALGLLGWGRKRKQKAAA